MIDIKDVYVQTFLAIKQDTQLLDLLEIKYENVEPNEFMTQLRSQVVDTSHPDDMLTDNATRLSIHEQDESYRSGKFQETAYLAVDINVTKDKNAKDRRSYKIMKRLIEVLDSDQRKKECKQPLPIGLDGLVYVTRLKDNQRNTTTGWEKHTVVFKYSYLL